MKKPLSILVLALFLLAPHVARAACSSPSGAAGNIFYNSDYATYQFCDGTQWWSMKSGMSATETDPQVGTLTNGKWCTSDGSAVNCTSNAPSASPAGSDTQIQYNNSGAFGGSSNLTWDGSTLSITGAVQTSDRIKITGTTGLDAPTTP